MSMKEYLIEVKKHYDSMDQNIQMQMGLSHFKEFVLNYNVNNYAKLASPFIKYLNGKLELDEFVGMIR